MCLCFAGIVCCLLLNVQEKVHCQPASHAEAFAKINPSDLRALQTFSGRRRPTNTQPDLSGEANVKFEQALASISAGNGNALDATVVSTSVRTTTVTPITTPAFPSIGSKHNQRIDPTVVSSQRLQSNIADVPRVTSRPVEPQQQQTDPISSSPLGHLNIAPINSPMDSGSAREAVVVGASALQTTATPITSPAIPSIEPMKSRLSDPSASNLQGNLLEIPGVPFRPVVSQQQQTGKISSSPLGHQNFKPTDSSNGSIQRMESVQGTSDVVRISSHQQNAVPFDSSRVPVRAQEPELRLSNIITQQQPLTLDSAPPVSVSRKETRKDPFEPIVSSSSDQPFAPFEHTGHISSSSLGQQTIAPIESPKDSVQTKESLQGSADSVVDLARPLQNVVPIDSSRLLILAPEPEPHVTDVRTLQQSLTFDSASADPTRRMDARKDPFEPIAPLSSNPSLAPFEQTGQISSSSLGHQNTAPTNSQKNDVHLMESAQGSSGNVLHSSSNKPEIVSLDSSRVPVRAPETEPRVPVARTQHQSLPFDSASSFLPSREETRKDPFEHIVPSASNQTFAHFEQTGLISSSELGQQNLLPIDSPKDSVQTMESVQGSVESVVHFSTSLQNEVPIDSSRVLLRATATNPRVPDVRNQQQSLPFDSASSVPSSQIESKQDLFAPIVPGSSNPPFLPFDYPRVPSRATETEISVSVPSQSQDVLTSPNIAFDRERAINNIMAPNQPQPQVPAEQPTALIWDHSPQNNYIFLRKMIVRRYRVSSCPGVAVGCYYMEPVINIVYVPVLMV
ncbi:hypothetical protein DPMN_106360 [Dreissena polymorpha]|uniref:Uncharacterized protein n=1 Tax=Dreissena polymorpha TaxID=45954 RepID=A0A9D4K517_DREPO|nr:hypothetical protein DPMN_106360 [Dreissena polymorpha]